MKTFNLTIVQRMVLKQLEASSNLLGVIDNLQAIRGSVNKSKLQELDSILRVLTTVSDKLVDSAGNTSELLENFASR